MARESESTRAVRSIAPEGSGLPPGAKNCPSKFGRVIGALWPKDTAKSYARKARVSVRTAKYRLSGGYRPTGDEVRLIINEMLDE